MDGGTSGVALSQGARVRPRAGTSMLAAHGLARWAVPVLVWDAPQGFDTTGHPDRHPHPVVALRLAGGLVQRVRPGRSPQERLSIGGFSVHPAGRDLRFLAPRAIRFAHFYLPDAHLLAVARELHGTRAEGRELLRDDKVMFEDGPLVAMLADYLARAGCHEEPPTALEMDSRANLIALRVLGRHSALAPHPPPCAPERGGLAPWQLARVRDHLMADLAADVTLADLAALAKLSTYHFCRAFKASTGLPPHRWRAARRIDRARDLLAGGDLPVTEVAALVGFDDPGGFALAFRKATGLSPSQYRRAYRA